MPYLEPVTAEGIALLLGKRVAKPLVDLAQATLDAFFGPLLEGGEGSGVNVNVMMEKGKGIRATKQCAKGDCLYTEPVLVAGLVKPGAFASCAHCFRPSPPLRSKLWKCK